MSLPTSGAASGVASAPNSASSQGNQVLLVARAPGPQWTPTEIVSGFLAAAGAGFATLSRNLSPDLTIARRYLTPTYSRVWHPTGPPHVIDTNFTMNQYQTSPRLVGSQASSLQVAVTSEHLEVLQNDRLQVSSQAAPYSFTFTLKPADGRLRISGITGMGEPSKTITLLTTADFLRAYQPRDLYFLARGGATSLVPSPVYIPDSAPYLGVPLLVDALRKLPPDGENWLVQAVTTAFRRHTKLSVQVHSDEAVIDIGGDAASATPTRILQMEAQLVQTLTDDPYAAGTGIRLVQVHVAGHTSSPLLRQYAFTSWLPKIATKPLYYQTLSRTGHPMLYDFTSGTASAPKDPGQNARLSKKRRTAAGGPSPVGLPPGLGRGAFTAIAVSSPTLGIPVFAGCRGRNLYMAPLLDPASPLSLPLQGTCSSLTWDDAGDLWIAVGTDVYVYVTATATSGLATGLHPVAIPSPPQIPDNATFASIKVAPDGLRVAMIVRGKGGPSVLVGAISTRGSVIYLAQSRVLLSLGPDLADPVALSWWDADHLLVLDRRSEGAELKVVPLDGGESIPVPTTPPGAQWVTANGQIIAVGTASQGRRGHPEIFVSSDRGLLWQQVEPGSTPAYPG